MTLMQIRDDKGRKITLHEVAEGDVPPELPEGFRIEAADSTPLWRLPDAVDDYQFAGEAEARGFITAEECDAWVGPGELPEVLLQKVEQAVPNPVERRPVILFLMGAKQIPREHPNTRTLAAMFGLTTPDQVDDFFASAARR